jgi:hypothetical protein
MEFCCGPEELSFRHGGKQTCFRNTRMGVDIETYRARIGGFVLGKKVESGMLKRRQEACSAEVWFIGLVNVTLLVVGGVETNPGPQIEQVKIDQILAYVKNQEKESTVIKQMYESHKQEMSEIRKGTNALGPKFDLLSEIVTEMINDYGQIKQAIRECEARYQQLENKLRHVDEGQRKNNIIIFGLKEQGEEIYSETLDMTVKWLSETMEVETTRGNIDYVICN